MDVVAVTAPIGLMCTHIKQVVTHNQRLVKTCLHRLMFQITTENTLRESLKHTTTPGLCSCHFLCPCAGLVWRCFITTATTGDRKNRYGSVRSRRSTEGMISCTDTSRRVEESGRAKSQWKSPIRQLPGGQNVFYGAYLVERSVYKEKQSFLKMSTGERRDMSWEI